MEGCLGPEALQGQAFSITEIRQLLASGDSTSSTFSTLWVDLVAYATGLFPMALRLRRWRFTCTSLW